MRGVGTLAIAGVAGSVPAAAAETWTVADTETDSTLHDVTIPTAAPHAVGDGGVVLERDGDLWKTVIKGGPTGNGNDLYGADVTDDGERLWFVGASGAIGEYDPDTGSMDDHSAPNDNTNNYNGVAVTGRAGDANVYVAGDSGKIYYSFDNGESGTWEYVTPGSGSSIQAIDFHGPRAGHAVDTNGKVFATNDGSTWEAIGIADANVNFYGVDSRATDLVTVVGGNGMVFEWDGAQWTPTNLGDASLRDVVSDGSDGYTVADGGVIFDLTDGVWDREDTPTGENLKGVAVGDNFYAVGASGMVLEG